MLRRRPQSKLYQDKAAVSKSQNRSSVSVQSGKEREGWRQEGIPGGGPGVLVERRDSMGRVCAHAHVRSDTHMLVYLWMGERCLQSTNGTPSWPGRKPTQGRSREPMLSLHLINGECCVILGSSKTCFSSQKCLHVAKQENIIKRACNGAVCFSCCLSDLKLVPASSILSQSKALLSLCGHSPGLTSPLIWGKAAVRGCLDTGGFPREVGVGRTGYIWE